MTLQDDSCIYVVVVFVRVNKNTIKIDLITIHHKDRINKPMDMIGDKWSINYQSKPVIDNKIKKIEMINLFDYVILLWIKKKSSITILHRIETKN